MLQVRRLGYALGAELTGIDLRRELDSDTVADIRRAILAHVVVCFPGQVLNQGQLLAFARRFGDVDSAAQSMRHDPNNAGVMLLSNKPVVIGGKSVGGYGATDFWHSDFSFSRSPNTITFLAAKVLPEVGGDTMFANGYLAFESLSPTFQRIVEPLRAIHDYALGARCSPEQLVEMRRRNPLVTHPVVQTHPETGRKTLYVSERVSGIAGMTEAEAAPLLRALVRHAARYEFTYRHRWSVDDLVLWDNRCSLHYAVQDYDRDQTREMLRCSLRGPQTGAYLEEAGACEDAVIAASA